MKKILFVPQISNRSYSTSKWVLLKDAHIKVIKNQMQVLNLYGVFEFIVFLPPLEQVEDVKDYNEIFYEEFFSSIKVKVIPIKASKNVAYNRFHFDMNELLENKYILDIDYVITDIPETARNFFIFYSLQKKHPKIIVNVHYIDLYPENQINPGQVNYFWRQLDGIVCADKVTFFTDKMMKDYYAWGSHFLTLDFIGSLVDKSSVLDYMCISEYELNTYKTTKNENKTIFFISRCSDDKRTKWKEFIVAVKELRKLRKDFDVFIANPTEVEYSAIIKETGNVNYIKIPEKPLTRKQYIEKLWQCHCVPLLYDIENNISIGFYEAIYCNTVPVQFGVAFKDMKDLVMALNNALDNDPVVFKETRNGVIIEHSCEQNANRFYNEFIATKGNQ